jgi:glycosyltransferase involved in cell wall biosynthesis
MSPIHVAGYAEGVTQNLRHMLDGLRRHGVDVSLLTPSQAPEQLGRPFSTLARGAELVRLLNRTELEADIIHINLQNPSQAILLKRLALSKAHALWSVWDAYVGLGDLIDLAQSPGPSGLIAEHLPHFLLNTPFTARLGLSGLGTVVVSCKFLESRILRLGVGRARVHVIPNGVDTEEYRPAANGSERQGVRENLGIGTDRRVVLYYGHATRVRGLDTLIWSMMRVLRTIPDAFLLIAESGRRTMDLERQIREAGISEKTMVLGHVDVPRILRAADVGVLPLASHLGAAMIPNTLLEMMAAGLPVVATRVGAMPELVSHDETGLLVAPGDSTGLAEAIVRLLRNEWMRDQLGRAGHQLVVERYEWSLSIDRLLQLYHTMMN